jgi:hypothetical protein
MFERFTQICPNACDGVTLHEGRGILTLSAKFIRDNALHDHRWVSLFYDRTTGQIALEFHKSAVPGAARVSIRNNSRFIACKTFTHTYLIPGGHRSAKRDSASGLFICSATTPSN